MLIQGSELQIYDLEENKMAEQDTALSEFLEPWLGSYGDVNSRPYLLYMPQTEHEGVCAE